MRTCLLLISMLVTHTIWAQTGKRYYFPVIGWQIDLPAGFTVSDSSGSTAYLQKAVTMLKKVSSIKVDASETQVLIVAENNNNSFNVIATPFDKRTERNWDEQHAELKTTVYNSFKKALPGVTIDTISSRQMIDSITFEKFVTTLHLNDKTSTTVALSCLYRGYDVGITYAYDNDAVRQQLETMLANSNFSKETGH